MVEHRRTGKFEILGACFPGTGAIDQLHHVHRAFGHALTQGLYLRFVAHIAGQAVDQRAHRLMVLAQPQILVGDGAGAAGEANIFLAAPHIRHAARQFPTRRKQIDLEDQGIPFPLRIENIAQRRVRNEAAVPIMTPVDLDRRQAWRQRAGGHDMACVDAGGIGGAARIEILEIARFDIHRANRNPHWAVVQQIPVDQLVERFGQWRAVIIADGGFTACGGPIRHGPVRNEEARYAKTRHRRCSSQMGAFAQPVLVRQNKCGHAAGHHFPEGAQRLDPFLGRVARDQRGIDGADGDARDAGKRYRVIVDRFEHAGLIAAKRAAALQQQHHLIGQRQAVAWPGPA